MAESEFTLSERPDISMTVGGLIMAVANFEATLMGCFATLLDQPVRIAAAIFENINNISARAGIVFDLAELQPDTPLGSALITHKDKISAALRMRNRVAHGLYGFDEDNRQVLLLENYLVKGKGPPKSSVLEPKILEAHAQDLSDAAVALTNLIGDTDMTPRHRQKNGG